MTAHNILAIIPMKPLHLSKTRLSAVLSPAQRAALSLGMLHGVISAATQSNLSSTWVVGGDDAVRQTAESLGAAWRKDHGSDLNDSLTLAVQQAFRCGKTPLYLPADLPFLTAQDVNGILAASNYGASLTLAPAKRDGGTNAMLIPCGSPFRPMLGSRSLTRHTAQAHSLNITPTLYRSDGFGLDLDTPDDLTEFIHLEQDLISRLMSLASASAL